LNAEELLDRIAALPEATAGVRPGAKIETATVVAGIEVAMTSAGDERMLKGAWKARQGGGAQPLLLVANDPDKPDAVRVLGPRDSDGPVRSVTAEALLTAVQRASKMPELEAVREIAPFDLMQVKVWTQDEGWTMLTLHNGTVYSHVGPTEVERDAWVQTKAILAAKGFEPKH
jgi:hypothetical protein